MYTIALKNRKKSLLSFTLIMVVSLGIFMQGCNMEEELLDENLINSPELEEFIIAGADFDRSFTIFEEELSKIDFSKLEVSYDADGRKVMRFPAGSMSVRIEEKINSFNEKKEKLLKKHPQVISFTSEKTKKHISECTKSSLKVSSKFLELGYNASRPLLKGGTIENFSGYNAIRDYLCWYILQPNFIELYIVVLTDGTYMIYLDDRNTYKTSHLPLDKITNHTTGTITYTFPTGGSNTPVAWVAHTHQYSSNPGDGDTAHPGLNTFIWYDGELHQYPN